MAGDDSALGPAAAADALASGLLIGAIAGPAVVFSCAAGIVLTAVLPAGLLATSCKVTVMS